MNTEQSAGRGRNPFGAAVLGLVFFASGAAAGLPLGSADLEPGLQGRTDIVFFEDFEAADWYLHWDESSEPANCQPVTSPVFDGTSALRVHVSQGDHYGVSMGFDFADWGLEEPEEIYFRYYVYFAENWRRDGGEVGKLPGISGTYGVAGWGGRPSHGDDGWSARMMNHDLDSQVKVGFYCYHADMTGTYGDHLGWEIDANGYLDRERWYAIEAYAKMNTISGGQGNNDGVLRGWVDGKLAFERTDLRFRDIEALKIEMIWFNIYVGGSWTAPQDMDVYFDNVVIATDYVGPMDASPATQAPNCSISADPTALVEGGSVQFTAAASDPDGGAIQSYEWDFDYDGASFDPDETGEEVSHTFSVPGTFTVALRVTDDEDETAIATVEIVVWVDSDSDGLPDWWEERYFGGLDEGAGGDPDEDGWDNLREYQEGTDPTNPDTDGDGYPDAEDPDPLETPLPFHGGCGAEAGALAALVVLLIRRRRGN